jgi:hypothetical protein
MLMGKARAMCAYSKLPPSLWEDLYLTSTHLHVCTLARSATVTLFEIWYSRKPDYSYIHEINCNAYVLTQNKHNPKIYERSVKCVLVSYDMSSKAYLCWSHDDQKMYKSYHVCFIKSHETLLTLDHINDPIPILPRTPTNHIPSTVDKIFQTASTEPLPYNEEEEEYLPPNQTLNLNHDQAPLDPDPASMIQGPCSRQCSQINQSSQAD